jgi:signal transduction histidine kinase
MKKWLQKNIVYFIAVIILVTLFIQAYWNVKNYEANKITVNNEVLAALNNSVDAYYTNLAKNDLQSTMTTERLLEGTKVPEHIKLLVDSVMRNMPEPKGVVSDDPILGKIVEFSNVDSAGQPMPPQLREILNKAQKSGPITASGTIKIPGKDSLSGINMLATKVIISLSNDSIDFKNLTKYLNNELKRKGLNFKYALSHAQEGEITVNYGNPKNKNHELEVESTSAYLAKESHLKMYYPNINLIALKEGFVGILLSFLFTIAIIASLIYLLRIIRQQKQIVLSKNDFISNISHELKTPIATSLSALEAIQHFNASNDAEKTEKYMGIASQQLQKLNVMVEKILDTAALDSDKLALHKEMIDVVPVIKTVVEKHQLNTAKDISLVAESNILLANIDAFHFENVINNIVENAIKYGGNTIAVAVTPAAKHAVITVTDNGNPIDKNQRNKIFDKFYRVSTNNRHDVKGYGIGLYYSKNIIEKHGGKLTLEDDAKHTIFKITVPYV